MRPENRSSAQSLLSAVDVVRQRMPDIVAVYRFGSHGTADQRPDSDLDLAVLATTPADPVQLWLVGQEAAHAAGRDVDLLDLGRAGTVMAAQVVWTGARVFCRDQGAAEAFEARAYAAYALLNEERRGILEDIRRRGTIHGD